MAMEGGCSQVVEDFCWYSFLSSWCSSLLVIAHPGRFQEKYFGVIDPCW